MGCKGLSFHTKDEREYYRFPIFQKVGGEGIYVQDREEYFYLKRGWKIKSDLGKLKPSKEMPIWQHDVDHCHVVWKILGIFSCNATKEEVKEKSDKEIEDDLRNVIKNARTGFGRVDEFLKHWRTSSDPGYRDFENVLSFLEEVRYG